MTQAPTTQISAITHHSPLEMEEAFLIFARGDNRHEMKFIDLKYLTFFYLVFFLSDHCYQKMNI